MYLLRNTFKRIAVGLSGGVDSAVSALLLKKRGFEVTGVFMKNWDSVEESGKCSYITDLEDVDWVCSKLNISLKVVDFVKDYWNNVFVRFIDEHVQGFTPNPDVWCNKHLKFSKFPDYSLHNLECDAVATGHYANTSFGNFLEYYKENENVHLLKARDTLKDQTFFLCHVSQLALRKTMFPVGNLTKSEVKRIAQENMFHRILKRKESMGICFIGSRNFKKFISEYIPDRSGRFISLDSGENIGSHNGVHYWAVGERCRLAGCLHRTYIVRKNPETQDIYVAGGRDHPALHILGIETFPPCWISGVPKPLIEINNSVLECDFRFQHTHPLRKCFVVQSSNGGLIINLEEPLSSVSAGQFIVFYNGTECLGGAEILRTGPSLFTLGETLNK